MKNQQKVKKEAMAEQKEGRLIEYLSVQTQCQIFLETTHFWIAEQYAGSN